MVAGVQITDGSGDTWPTAFLLTADELAPGIVDDCLDGSLDLGDIEFYTCADDDTLSVRVHGAAGRLRDSLTQEHSGRWRIGDCVDFPPGRSRAKSRG